MESWEKMRARLDSSRQFVVGKEPIPEAICHKLIKTGQAYFKPGERINFEDVGAELVFEQHIAIFPPNPERPNDRPRCLILDGTKPGAGTLSKVFPCTYVFDLETGVVIPFTESVVKVYFIPEKKDLGINIEQEAAIPCA